MPKDKNYSPSNANTSQSALFVLSQGKGRAGISQLSFYPKLIGTQASPSESSLSRDVILRLIEALKEM